MTVKTIAISIGGVALAGFALWSIYAGPLRRRDPVASPSIPALSQEATSSKEAATTPETPTGKNYEATETTAPQKKADISSLSRPILIPASFSSEDALLTKESIVKLVEAIKETPENGALWADLGMKRKGIEDYEGAKEAYLQALVFMPNNAVVSDNLGVIYGDYLKDYPKAEQYFRTVLAADPAAGYLYMRLFDLYQYGLKDTAKAHAILEEGLKAAPGDPGLQALLETVR
mgnify:FL=1